MWAVERLEPATGGRDDRTMMRFGALTAIPLLVLISACSSRENPTPRRDGGQDGGSSMVDASRESGTPPDAPMTDAGSTDARAVDSGSSDAGPTDAGHPDGGDGTCGDLGKACSSPSDCGGGLTCGDVPVCTPPSRPICGGFAAATCPAAYPSCLYCMGCDFGPCFRAEELACVCATAAGRTTFPGCT